MKQSRFFLYSAGMILLLSGLAKLVSSFGHNDILKVNDPLFHIPFRFVFLSAAVIECVIAFLCFYTKHARIGIWLVTWLATVFAAYRFGLWLVHWHKPCNCMGDLTGALHISQPTADAIMSALLLYLLCGGYGSLFNLWRNSRSSITLNTASIS